MCTVNMSFEVPDTKHIDIEALKHQMNAFFHVIISTPSIIMPEKTEKQKYDMSFFDCFDGGGWADDPRSANEIADELHDSRVNNRPIIEPW